MPCYQGNTTIENTVISTGDSAVYTSKLIAALHRNYVLGSRYSVIFDPPCEERKTIFIWKYTRTYYRTIHYFCLTLIHCFCGLQTRLHVMVR